MFVDIQQSKWSGPVFSDCGRYWKLHNEYHQHVQQRLHVPRQSLGQHRAAAEAGQQLKISKIEKNVSIDPTRNCIQT